MSSGLPVIFDKKNYIAKNRGFFMSSKSVCIYSFNTLLERPWSLHSVMKLCVVWAMRMGDNRDPCFTLRSQCRWMFRANKKKWWNVRKNKLFNDGLNTTAVSAKNFPN